MKNEVRSKRAPDSEPKASERRASRIIDVSAGLIFRAGKLLITQRKPGDHLGGLWEFPGGKREPRESFEVCLERELMEELGVVVEIRELIGRVTHRYPEKTVRLHFYRCAWLKHEPEPIGCNALAWIDRDHLDRYAFPPADAQLLRKLESSPELWA